MSTFNSGTLHWPLSAVEEIRAYHKNNGYSDIAYNFLVCNHGQVFVGRGWHVQSAATCGSYWNSRAWSVCWMGGPGFSPTPQALGSIRSVIDEARARGASTVIGHRDACATECPGSELHAWVHSGAPAEPAPAPLPPPPIIDSGDLGMDGIFHGGLWHWFSVRDDGALIERYGGGDNPNLSSVVMPPGWCRPGDGARVKVLDPAPGSDALGYAVAALRAQGDIPNVAVWTGSGWVLRGWPS